MAKQEADTLAMLLGHAEALQRVGAADAADVAKIRKITARGGKPDFGAVHIMTGKQIRQLRVANNVSQAVFADALNTSISTVQKWEANVNSPQGPALKLLNLIERKGLEAVV